MAAWCRRRAGRRAGGKPDGDGGAGGLGRAPAGPVDLRVTALARWVSDGKLDPATRNALENVGRTLRARTRDVVGEWAALLTDREALGEGFASATRRGCSPRASWTSIHRWCVDRDRLRTPARRHEDDERALRARRRGRRAACCASTSCSAAARRRPRASVAYEHLMVDEVQDFAPLELAVLLDSTTKERSITLAGDTAQAIAPEHGFSTWTGHARLSGDPPRSGRAAAGQLPLDARRSSTAPQHVLGPLHGRRAAGGAARGAPVESFGFASAGEASEFLAQALKELVRAEPDGVGGAASPRHPEQARLYYEALSRGRGAARCAWWPTRTSPSAPASTSPTCARPRAWSSTSSSCST